MKIGNMLFKWWRWDQDDICEKGGWEEDWKEIDNQGMGDIVRCWKRCKNVKPAIGGSEGHSLWFILIFPELKV